MHGAATVYCDTCALSMSVRMRACAYIKIIAHAQHVGYFGVIRSGFPEIYVIQPRSSVH